MRHLRPTYPEFPRVLLIESGPRPVLEAAIPRLTNVFGPAAAFDLFTCYPGFPATLPPGSAIRRTADHASKESRRRLLEEIRSTGVTAIAIICSGHSIMTRWKWWLAWRLPVKVLIINENADCFWLDTAHLSNARRMAFVRLGLSGNLAAPTLLRLALFPFGLVYLVLYASVVHAQRLLRLAFAPRPRP